MARDETFKRYEEAGAEFIESARSRAVEFLKELSQLGENTGRHAQGQVSDLVDIGKARSDAVVDTIRAEIRTQLAQLGLATKVDLSALERRIKNASAKKAPAAKNVGTGTAATKTVVVKNAPARKKAVAKKTAAAEKTAAAKKTVPAKKTTAVKKTAPKKTAPTNKAVAKKTTGAKKSAATKASGATAKS
jgi:polyhydroxyalkanoate synthesis regulator phasin